MIKLYGWHHIIYLLITLAITAGVVFVAAKYVKNQRVQTIIIKSVAASLLVAVTVNRITISSAANNWQLMIPTSFCGITSVVFSLSVLFTKRDSVFMHFVVYIAFVGAIVTLAYPDFIVGATSLFYPPNIITGLIHHSITLLLVLLVFATGYFKPDIKRWYAVPLGLTCYMTFGLYMYDIMKRSALSIGESFEGIDGLTWFNVGLIFLAGYAAFIISYNYFDKRKNQNKDIEN